VKCSVDLFEKKSAWILTRSVGIRKVTESCRVAEDQVSKMWANCQTQHGHHCEREEDGANKTPSEVVCMRKNMHIRVSRTQKVWDNYSKRVELGRIVTMRII
jgi:hypothetical protein